MSGAGTVLCPACGLKSGRRLYEMPDRSPLALSPILIGACSNCGHQFLINPPVNQLRDFYADDQDCYAFHQSDSYVRMKRIDSRMILLLLRRYARGRRLCEIGCGTGIFLDVARELKYETYGVEPSGWQAKVASQHGHTIHNGSLEDVSDDAGIFDAIAGIELIEHVMDLHSFMSRVTSLSRPGSVIYFSTGSTTSLWARTKGKKWRYYEVLHTQYFSPYSLCLLLERHGWKILETGSGFRLGDLWKYGRRDLSGAELIKKSLARVRVGPLTRSGIHVIARKNLGSWGTPGIRETT
jgi:SAM-dependent methyltransferase